MRLWPHSLFGRLLLILLGGLAMAQLLTTAVHWSERDTFVFRISTGRGAQRVADLVRVLDELTPAERERVTAKLNNPAFTIALGGPAQPTAGSREELADIFGDMLQRQLPARPLAVAVTTARNPRHPLPPDSGDSAEHYRLRVATTLADGTPVAFDLALPQRQPNLTNRLLWHLAILAAVMAVLVFIAVRWVTRPLSALAGAAERLGRNISQTPLDERGPTEVQRAARAFNLMQERLLRYVRTREHILAAMSHDLKTPITRLRLRAELLEDGALREKFTHDLDEMESMVGATLNLMRGLDSEEPLQPVDVGALLESLAFDYQDMGRAVKVESHVRRPLPARPQALKRCLQNLIDNALKYGTHAEVYAAEEGDSVVVRVVDDGPGIPEREIARVFDPYYRVESSRNRDTGGHGLGLTIARNVAQAHGGTIVLQNQAGGGLKAVACFPL